LPDYGHGLEFGNFFAPVAEGAAELIRLAEVSEELGFEMVGYQDHPYQARFLDTWTLLSFVAARTNRVKLVPNVLNVPLRPPAVLARAAAALDLLSSGRVELGLGAGAFWDAIDAMGGKRLTPGEGVDALTEAIEVMRELWDVGQRGHVHFEGQHYQLRGAARGPAPVHRIGLWIGAYKPRMLRLAGRLGDGWLPSVPYIERGDLAHGNRVIDAAAEAAGRDPGEVRRLLNVSGSYSDGSPGPLGGSTTLQVEELARLALEDGVSGFFLTSEDVTAMQRFITEVAPAVRELVLAERGRDQSEDEDAAAVTLEPRPRSAGQAAGETPESSADAQYGRLGVTPTPDDGSRLAPARWDESSRPHRPPSGPGAEYTPRGRAVGQHLIDVHDQLRRELVELREVLTQVRDGALSAGDARSALNQMALRQNDWTLGAFCSRYCRAVTQHHTGEDESIFPYLRQAEPALDPVVDRLTEEHLMIHDAIDEVDRALVHHLEHPGDFDRVQSAIDVLTDTLLSHLSYEEYELVEPLARVGFFAGQL
jgi:hypothetical protein